MAWVLLKKPQPAGGQCVWGQPSSWAMGRELGTCTATVLGEGQFNHLGSQRCLNITCYKGLFELTGYWTHILFQK